MVSTSNASAAIATTWIAQKNQLFASTPSGKRASARRFMGNSITEAAHLLADADISRKQTRGMQNKIRSRVKI
jgi:hypothetical protein